MRTFKYPLLGLSSLAILFTACGDDVTNVTKETSGLEVVASADSLGKCTEEISGEMKFVSKENAVYVCADSIWQSLSAKTSCFAESLKDNSGYKIVCGEDSVGVIFDGKDGAKGNKGESCTVSKVLKSDEYLVVCGNDTVGTLRANFDGEDCRFSDNGDGSVTQICGGDSIVLYKAFCGGEPIDLNKSFCVADSIVSRCGGKSYDIENTVCDARDGSLYAFITLGEQTWMAKNLDYAVPGDSSSFCYDGNIENCEKFGRLYKWEAALEVCPEGWRTSDTADWNKLEKFVAEKIGGVDNVGYALKSEDAWEEDGKPYGYGSDKFGFGILPAGKRDSSGSFTGFGRTAFFWTPTEIDELSAKSVVQYAHNTRVSRESPSKKEARSVRCVKD